MRKLYVIVDRKLSPGLKMAQGIHAFQAFSSEHPDVVASWYEDSNNIVVLESDDIAALSDSLSEKDLMVAEFHEPDLEERLTAIATIDAGRWLSSLPLAGQSKPAHSAKVKLTVVRPEGFWAKLKFLLS